MRHTRLQRINALGVAVVLAVAIACAGACSPATQKKLIVSANEAQDAAAQTYQVAKQVEDAAAVKCRAVLLAAAAPLPTKPEEIQPRCAAIGSPVPYDPVKLQKAAGPINALYDGIRAANAQRIAGGGDAPASVLAGLVTLFENVIADLVGAGIAVPPSVNAIPGTIRAATGGAR